jgi:hypothetical protein
MATTVTVLCLAAHVMPGHSTPECMMPHFEASGCEGAGRGVMGRKKMDYVGFTSGIVWV